MTSTLSPLPLPHNLASSSLSLGNGITLAAQVDFKPIPNPINLQQVGEEVEGIVMLSLLKQRLESLSESIKNGSTAESGSEDDSERLYRKHHLSSSTGRKRRASFGDSLAKRPKSEMENLQEDTRSWMDMFNVAKRSAGFAKSSNESFRELRRTPSDLQIQIWIQKQFEMKSKGLLSEERVELLKLIGIDVTESKRISNRNSVDSSSYEEEFEDDASEREDNVIRRKRNSFSIAIPNHREVPKTTLSPSKRGGAPSILGKKKASLKRNSLHNWVYNQRRLESEGNLPIHRKKLLDKIDFDWKFGAKGEEQSQSSQEEIVSSRSSSPIPGLSEPIFNEENALPYDVPNSKSEELWMSRYKELIEFKAKNGNFDVPRYAE